MFVKQPSPDIFVIRNGRIIDPHRGIDRIDDLVVADGRIRAVGPSKGDDEPAIDARGWIVCPGLIDMHVHLREPGGEHKETIGTGTRAAAAGGFTAVACMPNTKPAIDNVETLRFVLDRARQTAACRVYPVAAITLDRRGRELVDMAALKRAGAVAFSDDGDGVEDDAIMGEAFRRARDLGTILIQHCEFKSISAGGCLHQGAVSEALGLPGLDPRSEESMIERDIALVRRIGGRYHVAHISTAKAVDLVRRAKADGLPVSAEVCPHHLLLTDESCRSRDPNTKMHPPLRSRADVAACLEGVADGTIDCIVTDHAPHAAEEKGLGFVKAPPGIVGLETSLALAAKALVVGGFLDWPGLIARMTVAPASILGLPIPSLSSEAPADLTLIDPQADWRVDAAKFHSLGRNTPFDGWEVTGRPVATFVGGRLTHSGGPDADRFAQFGPVIN